jgi:hypothetical protein
MTTFILAIMGIGFAIMAHLIGRIFKILKMIADILEKKQN